MEDDRSRLSKLRRLTPRQVEVLELRCQRRTLKEIASDLIVEERTVKYHLEGIYARLEIAHLAQGARLVELGRFCPVLAQIDAGALPDEATVPVLPEPERRQAELAVLEDELALVQSRQAPLVIRPASPPEPPLMLPPLRRPRFSGRTRAWVLLIGAMLLGVVIGALAIASRNRTEPAPTVVTQIITATPLPTTVAAAAVTLAPTAAAPAVSTIATTAPTVTATLAPSTPTSVPPTPTPLLPTSTAVPPTSTPVPPTRTPLPPTATPLPAALPKPQPGSVLYRADWSSGLNGWPSAGGWKVLRGMLVNDGSGNGQLIPAPYRVRETDDYAVESEIQVVSAGFDYGLYLRDGYKASCDTFAFSSPCLILGGDLQLGRWEYHQTPGWHTYRLEADGNQIGLLIDGAPLGEVTDNQFLSGSRVGLWSNGLQLNVRSFRVIAL